MHAARNGHVEVARLLLEHKADANVVDKVRRKRTASFSHLLVVLGLEVQILQRARSRASSIHVQFHPAPSSYALLHPTHSHGLPPVPHFKRIPLPLLVQLRGTVHYKHTPPARRPSLPVDTVAATLRSLVSRPRPVPLPPYPHLQLPPFPGPLPRTLHTAPICG